MNWEPFSLICFKQDCCVISAHAGMHKQMTKYVLMGEFPRLRAVAILYILINDKSHTFEFKNTFND
jgi:hypothetical protein